MASQIDGMTIKEWGIIIPVNDMRSHIKLIRKCASHMSHLNKEAHLSNSNIERFMNCMSAWKDGIHPSQTKKAKWCECNMERFMHGLMQCGEIQSWERFIHVLHNSWRNENQIVF